MSVNNIRTDRNLEIQYSISNGEVSAFYTSIFDIPYSTFDILHLINGSQKL